MDKYHLLNSINTNFHKLFTACKDGVEYIPLQFETSNDTESLLILSQLLELMFYTRNTNDFSSKLTKAVLFNIITIRCKEFVATIPWNNNYDNFIKTFEDYLNKLLDDLNK